MFIQAMIIPTVLFAWSITAMAENTSPSSSSRQSGSAVQAAPVGGIPKGVYKGPSGTSLQVRGAVQHGARLSQLASQGIIVVGGKPKDGRYAGPNGQSFVVEHGIIIINNMPKTKRLRVR
jgi:hypothetical protein